MMKVTWEYYNSHFPKLSEEDFDKTIYRATKEVTKRLPKKEYDGENLIDINDCICEVVNELHSQSKSNGLSSVSNDGYSESYVSRTTEESKEKLNSIIDSWVGYLIPKFIGF